MTQLATGSNIGVAFCEALGLKANDVTSITLTVLPDDLVKVDVTFRARVEQMTELHEVLREYKLVPREEIKEITPLGAIRKEFTKHSADLQ